MLEIVAISVIIAWAGLLVGLCFGVHTIWNDGDKGIAIGGGIIFLAIWVGCTSFFIYTWQHPDTRPCVKYDTTYVIDSNNTMQPVRYCSQYGEWVNK